MRAAQSDPSNRLRDGAGQGGTPFLNVKTPTTSAQAGARGGNELFLDGSVHWKNIKQMTNYAASPWGSAYMNSW